MLLRTCFALFVVAGAWAQPATPPKKGDGPLTRSSFTAKGLHHEDDLTDLFTGNFAALPFDRGSVTFNVVFQTYLEAYSRRCGAYLHDDKVEMTAPVCNDAPFPTTPGQPPPPPRACSVWSTVPVGYADPVLYAAKKQLDVEQAANTLKDLAGSMRNLMRPNMDGLQITTDMDAIVRLNACAGPGLRRFQENVVLFSKGKPPLLLPGASPVTPSALPPGALADSDYNRLVEDLVADQAKTWTFNRYVPGSVSHLLVGHDPTGQPAKIVARYLFSSLTTSGRTQGSVTVSFTDGMPKCIYFFDAPSTCQTPNRRIVAKYSSGGYVDPSALPPASSPAAAAPVQPPPNRDPSVQAKAQAEASVRGSICVPDDLLAEWRNPPPGGKMEAFQLELKASLRDRAKSPQYDQTKWMTVNSRLYSTWKPGYPFRGAVRATDGGSCAVGHREFLALTP